MTNITTFDSANLTNLRADINVALAAVSSAYGISLNLGTGRYSDNNVTLKLEGSIISNGTVKTKGAVALERFYPAYVGKVVTLYNGKKGKVIEYHSRKRKYPFIVEVGNKRYKLSRTAISHGLWISPEDVDK